MSTLSDEDATGHIYWGKFRELAEEVFPKKESTFIYNNPLDWLQDIPGKFVVYILKCKKDKNYSGYTGNFKQRILAHFNGMGGYTTKTWPPIYILHYEVFDTKREAIDRENFFKGWQGKLWLKQNADSLTSIKP